MDETCIRCFEARDRGNVFKRGLKQEHPHKKRRLCMTLVALVCDNTAVQSRLPQILIANEHTFLKRDIKDIVHACRPNMAIVR